MLWLSTLPQSTTALFFRRPIGLSLDAFIPSSDRCSSSYGYILPIRVGCLLLVEKQEIIPTTRITYVCNVFTYPYQRQQAVSCRVWGSLFLFWSGHVNFTGRCLQSPIIRFPILPAYHMYLYVVDICTMPYLYSSSPNKLYNLLARPRPAPPFHCIGTSCPQIPERPPQVQDGETGYSVQSQILTSSEIIGHPANQTVPSHPPPATTFMWGQLITSYSFTQTHHTFVQHKSSRPAQKVKCWRFMTRRVSNPLQRQMMSVWDFQAIDISCSAQRDPVFYVPTDKKNGADSLT